MKEALKVKSLKTLLAVLKNFFEHYIDVPDEKYNVLEDRKQLKLKNLEKKLNEQIEKNVELNKDNAEKN